MTMLLRLSLLLFLIATTVQSNEVDQEPHVIDVDLETLPNEAEAEDQLEGSGVRKGNGVVLSGDTLWITESDGSVRTLNITDGYKEIGEFRPVPLTDRTIECRSSISLHYDTNVKAMYGVYAILDVPLNDSHAIVSRIMSVSHTGDHLWESVISGVVSGTPQIDESGDRIYVIHNDWYAGDGSYTVGKLSVVRNDLYGLATEIGLERAGAFAIMDKAAPFGPLGITHQNGETNIYWGEAWEHGQAHFGMTYEYDGQHVQGLTRTLFSTIVAPIVRNGSMWIVGAASSVHAWIGPHSFTNQPSWSIYLEDDERAIEKEPIVASESDRLFVLTPSHQLFCVNSTTGDKIWTNGGNEVEPYVMQLSRDETALYTVGTEGIITSFDTATGRIMEQITCQELGLGDGCELHVEGEFAVSDMPQLFLADTDGDVVALRLDPSEYSLGPTESPSIAPSKSPADEPSVLPSGEPTSSPSLRVTSEPVTYRTREPTIPPTSDMNSSPAESPLFTPAMPVFYFPAYTPAMSPDQFPVYWPTTDIEIDSTSSPSDESFSDPAPLSIDDSLQVDLDRFKDSHVPILIPARSTISNFGAFCIASIFFLLTLCVGVLFGRVWQLRHTSFQSLPLNEHGSLYSAKINSENR